MERKLLCVLLCLGTAFGAWAQDEDEPSIDGLYYNFYSEVHTATVRYCENEIDVLEIDIPESVTYKGEEYKVTEIGNSAFSRCYKLKRITIPNTVTVIGYYAFRGCTALESINIPEGMTSIGLGVFYDCAGLKSITFPSSLVRILSGAFFGCSGLTSITLPEGILSVGEDAFANCTGLRRVYSENPVPPYCAYYAFSYSEDGDHFDEEQGLSSYANATLYVPEGSVAAYRNDEEGWGRFHNITAYDPTGIEGIAGKNGRQPQPIYDLQGRRQPQPQRGLNIIGGRKVLVK